MFMRFSFIRFKIRIFDLLTRNQISYSNPHSDVSNQKNQLQLVLILNNQGSFIKHPVGFDSQ